MKILISAEYNAHDRMGDQQCNEDPREENVGDGRRKRRGTWTRGTGPMRLPEPQYRLVKSVKHPEMLMASI
jgi:hypothetical protein